MFGIKRQRSLFDQIERKKQQGIEAAYQGANTYWRSAAQKALVSCAKMYREFTADQVWFILANKGVHTGNNSALGAIFQAGSRSGMIQKTGEYIESDRAVAHHRPITIWHSNIFKEKVK